jgi:hypothetical protein
MCIIEFNWGSDSFYSDEDKLKYYFYHISGDPDSNLKVSDYPYYYSPSSFNYEYVLCLVGF